MSQPRVSRARKGILVFCGIAAGLATAEIALHFVFPSLDFHFPTMRITDERFTERAGKVVDGNGVRYTFDAAGFRVSGARTPPANARTVLFIGDSFTQGFGANADETFPAVTCDQLERRGIDARCLNAGVTGFGTAHELRLLQTLLRREHLAVDAVVFQMSPYNDLQDNWEDGGFAVNDGTLVVLDPPRIPLPVRVRVALCENSLARASRLVILAANAWFQSSDPDGKADADAFALERRLLREVVSTTQARRIPIVLVVAATGWEVDQKPSQRYDERGRLDFFAATAAELQVPWIDARTVARAPEDYIPNDGHFSAAGNALIGAALAEKLAPFLQQ